MDYGIAGAVTAPLWIPAIIGGYLVGSTILGVTKFVSKHPKATLAGLALAGFLAYSSCWKGNLEDRIHAPAVQEVGMVSDSNVPQHEIRIHEEQGYSFYYVQIDDTLSRIAGEVMGDGGKYRTIMRDNGIDDPRDLTAGMLLRLRSSGCVPGARVYTRVPDLKWVDLPGTISIREHFGGYAEEVIAINAALGLDYSGHFPYPNGSRIVYYESYESLGRSVSQ